MPHASHPLLEFEVLQPFAVWHGISNRHNELEQYMDKRARQTHSTNYAWVDETSDFITDNVDALLTATPGVRLRIGVRDCTPIIVYDSSNHTGGVVHAGMQGTGNGILEQVLTQFNVSTTYIGIGPAIGACCYNAIDIKQENYLQALEAGVPEENIELSDICTKCTVDTYYSYRGGDDINFGAYFELEP